MASFVSHRTDVTLILSSLVGIQDFLGYRAESMLFNSYSASHDNWCTGTLLNRVITAQWEGMGDVGAARYEPPVGTTSPIPDHKGFKLL